MMTQTDYSLFARLMYHHLPELRGEIGNHLELADKKNLRLADRELRHLNPIKFYEGPQERIDQFLEYHDSHRCKEYDGRCDRYTDRIYRLVPQSEKSQYSPAGFISRRLEPMPHLKALIDTTRKLPSEAVSFLYEGASLTPATLSLCNRLGSLIFRARAEQGRHVDFDMSLGQEGVVGTIKPFVLHQMGERQLSVSSISSRELNSLHNLLLFKAKYLLNCLAYEFSQGDKYADLFVENPVMGPRISHPWAKDLGAKLGVIIGATASTYLQFFELVGFNAVDIERASHLMSEQMRSLAAESALGTLNEWALLHNVDLSSMMAPSGSGSSEVRFSENLGLFRSEILRVYDAIALRPSSEDLGG